MAFTKVAPAGIGSTPGDGYRIGDSFLHSTGVEITNINATGIVTAASLDISGAIDVDGHTNLDNVSIVGVTTITGTLLDLNSNSANPTIVKLRTNTNACEIEGRKVGGENHLVLSSNNSTDHLVISSTSVDLPNDNQLLRIGANNELKIAQDGTHNVSYIQNVGPLQFQTDDLRFYNYNTADLYFRAQTNAGVSLYYDHSNYSTAKLVTTATGVTIDGTAVAGALDISGNIDVDGHTNLDNVSIAGVTTITGSGNALEIVGGLVRSRNTASARFVANNGSAEGYFGWSSGVLTVGQAAATLSLEATGSNHIQLNTNGNERVRINSDGYLVKGSGLTCAFNVSGTNMTRSDTSAYVCDFDDDSSSGHFDSGNNFNTSTHKFVAPVSGYYYFFTNIRLDAFNSGYIRTAILSTSYHAGTTYYAIPATGHVITYADNGSIQTVQTSTVMYVPATHEVWVYQNPNSDTSYTVYLNESSFGGYFIG